MQEPHSELGKRERSRTVVTVRSQLRNRPPHPRSNRGFDLASEIRQHRSLKNLVNGEVELQDVPNPEHDLGCQKRMASDIKEVVVERYSGAIQHVGPHRGYNLFDSGRRRNEFVKRFRIRIGRRQRSQIELAVRS